MSRYGVRLISASVIIVLASGPLLAQKSQAVIARSNGFPSGPHFNLNLHGKKDVFACDPSATGGSSVFISEYGASTIEFVSNKLSSVTELTVLDPCGDSLDGDPARIQLPYDAQGYYVFARILGKPVNGASGEASSIVLTPAPVLELCNFDPAALDSSFFDATDCDDTMWSLGLITVGGVYQTTEAAFERFATASGGKGKSKALDITGLFIWSGYVCTSTLDVNGDGVIDEKDVPLTYDANGDGIIDATEFAAWLADQVTSGACSQLEDEWVFNIADLVVQGQEVTNDGAKLLQIRFYPVATTQFIR